MPFVIFGGLLINIDEIPDYFEWMSIFSFVQYGEWSVEMGAGIGDLGKERKAQSGGCRQT